LHIRCRCFYREHNLRIFLHITPSFAINSYTKY
jgi:hypothetical protein